MSITLTAHPMAFLINPKVASKEEIRALVSKKKRNIKHTLANLTSVKVMTNIEFSQIVGLMNRMENWSKIGEYLYRSEDGLTVQWKYSSPFCYAILSGEPAYKIVPKYSEHFFMELDYLCGGKNVRDINGKELFYYYYNTEYQDSKTLLKELKINGATEINEYSENEISAVMGGNIRYFKKDNEKYFTLETEQTITLMDIGLDDALTEIRIKTYIKENELKELLKSANYELIRGTNKMALDYTNTILEWMLEDGYYTIKFESRHTGSVRNEINDLFEKLNEKAGRDLLFDNEKSNITYSYKTNYMDKGVLINTLTEHGARNLYQDGENIYCELFDMQMSYTRKAENENYNLEINQVSNKNCCKDLIDDLNSEYGMNIQEITYKKILERLKSENMRLESEEISEDNSIILTIDVG